MYCQNCGQNLGEAARFCSKCGAVIAGGQETNPPPVPMQKQAAPIPSNSFSLKKLSRKTKAAIAIAAIAFIGAGLMAEDKKDVKSNNLPASGPATVSRAGDPPRSSSIPGGGPPAQPGAWNNQNNASSAGSYQQWAANYSAIMNEVQRISAQWSQEMNQTLPSAQTNPTQQNVAAVSAVYRRHMQQMQNLQGKLSLLQPPSGSSQQDVSDMNQIQGLLGKYITYFIQFDQAMIQNPMTSSSSAVEGLKKIGQEMDQAVNRLTARHQGQ